MTPNPNPRPELLPCPFCGSENIAAALQPEEVGYRGSVQCSNCWARGPRTYIGDWCAVLIQAGSGRPDRGEMGAAGWNTRALSQTLPAPGEVERNLEAQRQAIEACARIADNHAEPTDTPDDFTQGYERAAVRIARSIRKLCPNAALATVAAANDEGVAEAIEALEPFTRVHPHKNEAGASAILIPVTVADVRRATAAIRLLSQGEGK